MTAKAARTLHAGKCETPRRSAARSGRPVDAHVRPGPTPVEDDAASESDEEEYLARNPWMRRNPRWDEDDNYVPPGRMSGRGRVGVHYENQIPRS